MAVSKRVISETSFFFLFLCFSLLFYTKSRRKGRGRIPVFLSKNSKILIFYIILILFRSFLEREREKLLRSPGGLVGEYSDLPSIRPSPFDRRFLRDSAAGAQAYRPSFQRSGDGGSSQSFPPAFSAIPVSLRCFSCAPDRRYSSGEQRNIFRNAWEKLTGSGNPHRSATALTDESASGRRRRAKSSFRVR